MVQNQNQGREERCNPEAARALGAEQMRLAYQQMILIRRVEERSAREYASGNISGFCHLYIGQEAVAVGSLLAAKPTDHVMTAYRDHAHALLRGCTPRDVMAELFGKVTGAVAGRGGSMHLFNAEARFHGGHGIVGQHIPLAAGIAWASKYEGTDDVTLCYFGEGALNQGAFYESMNLASLWDLPVIYIVENNRYAMGTSLERASAMPELWRKGEGFDVEGVSVDGMDIAAMWQVVGEAVKRAREESRPTLIEARTYRFRGHSMSDPAKYRTKEELDDYKAADPIALCKATLLEEGWATEEELKAWDKEAREAAVDAAEFAKESPEPRLEDVGRYVYAEPGNWRPDEATFPHQRGE